MFNQPSHRKPVSLEHQPESFLKSDSSEQVALSKLTDTFTWSTTGTTREVDETEHPDEVRNSLQKGFFKKDPSHVYCPSRKSYLDTSVESSTKEKEQSARLSEPSVFSTTDEVSQLVEGAEMIRYDQISLYFYELPVN